MQQITSSVQSQPSDSRKLVEDLFHVLGIMKRGWRFIGISVALCLTIAGIYLAKTKPQYQGSTRLLILDQGGRPLNVGGVGDPLGQGKAQEALATHLMIIRSPLVLERAMKNAGLLGRASLDQVKVEQPDKTAKVIEISYLADLREEAEAVVKAVSESYEEFLRENYQQSAHGVITLIVEAREELARELQELEQEYLEFRKNSPSYTADQGGRTFVARRLDQWDQAANQAMTRTLQLKTQLELAQRLVNEGAGLESITGALRQLGGLGNASGPAMQGTSDRPAGPEFGRDRSTYSSYEELAAELANVEIERHMAERLLVNLRNEHQALIASHPVSDEEITQAFYTDPEASKVLDALNAAQLARDRISRVSAKASDPSIRHYDEQITGLKAYLDQLWKQKRPQILEALHPSDNGDLIRKAEIDLLALKARESTLRERIEQVRSEQLQRLRAEHEQLAQAHGPDHKKVESLSKQIEKLESGRSESHESSAGPATTLIGSLEESLKAIEAMRGEIQQRFDEDLAASKEAEIGLLTEANLLNNLERQRTLFDSVASQLKQAQLVSDFESVTAQVISPPNTLVVQPSKAFVFLLALIAGCGMGGVAAFLADLLDARVRTLAEMRAILDLPVLATIPQLPSKEETGESSVAMLTHQSPRSFLAESYKSARTNLEFLRRNRRAQVLLISSPNPGDGKSTTASNLAISLAIAGRKVLLIDGDLRKPSLHEIYDVDQELGLTRLLREHITAFEAVQPSMIENLDLISTGSMVANPSELLASDRLAAVLDEVRPAYDVVIVDSSPLLAVTDPSILSASVDGMLLVVRTGSSRRHEIERTMELLKTLGTPVLGAVINGVTREQSGNYGYGYGYGYGRPYGTPLAPEAPSRATSTGRLGTLLPGTEMPHPQGNGKVPH